MSVHCAATLKILIVEDETNIRDLVCLHLESDGFHCIGASNGHEAIECLRTQGFDVIVLDLMLPGVSGLQLCRRIRSGEAHRHVPVLMLTARGEESDKLAGFESGADDYLTKPFSMRELSARVSALGRRNRVLRAQSAAPLKALELHGLRLDPARRSLRVRAQEVAVTAHEFRLIYQLAANQGIVYTRDRLLAEVWDGEIFVTGRSVDTLVHRLRCKIEDDPAHPRLILTVWGEGYKFAEG